jgi:hypothetical protein
MKRIANLIIGCIAALFGTSALADWHTVTSRASATVGYRTAVVDLAQSDSATRVGYENLMYVQQVGLWTGSVRS